MNTQFLVPDFLNEPERYELQVFPGSLELSRRAFLQIVGGGIVIALWAGDSLAQQQSNPERRPPRGDSLPKEIGAWLHISEDSDVMAFTGKVEIGQNIRTSLTQVVAEELHIPPSRIRLTMADTQLVPFDFGTAGSQTTPMMAAQLRRVGAAARELLLDLAAEEGKVDRTTLTVSKGKIIGSEGKPSFEFGQLTKGKKLVKLIGDKIPTLAAEKWTVAGTSEPKVDGRAFVTGSHRYASDIKRPGMLFGKVLRKPTFKSELVELQTRSAKDVPGVKVIHDGPFVGVVAPTDYEATQALSLLRPQWKSDSGIDGADLFKHLKSHPTEARGFGGPSRSIQGSIQEGLESADKKIAATYSIAYIAHVPLEPRAAVAEWTDDKLTVWTGTQRPFGVRGELAAAFGIPAERVRVIVPDMGSGYGGKHTGEAAVEAARLSKAAGKPVKLVWTREEEFTWAYFRPAGLIEVTAGAKKDGTLTAWEFHNYNSGASAIRPPYEIAHQRVEFHPADSPLRQGSYRALAATANHFARESHLDDLAHELAIDPLAMRLKNLKNDRVIAVLEAAAKRFGWGHSKAAEGHGLGVALGTEKGSYVATCAEVAADLKTGHVKIVRLTTAFECGAIVNPDNLKNQIEGALVMGLGGALFEEVRFAQGRILNPSLGDYKVPRFADVPVMETVLLDRKDLASAGAGETPIVALAPAVANAIFQATGQRLRSLPMAPQGLKAP